MKLKIFYVACLSLLAAVPVFSQVRTITNADLEKYKQKRLNAERDYAENYAKMGFPSPEELQKLIEKSRAERDTLAARLVAERVQLELAEAARAEAVARMNDQDIFIFNDYQNYPGYIYGFTNPFFHQPRFPRFKHRGFRIGSGPAAPTRIFGAPSTPYSIPTSPFGGGMAPRFPGKF